MGDKHLLEAWNRYVATGDQATFMEVYNVLYEDTLHMATAKCRNTHFEAEHIAGEVWSKLVRNKPIINSTIRGYLLVATTNTLNSLIRKNSKFDLYENPEDFVPNLEEANPSYEEILAQSDPELRRCLDKKDYQFIRQILDLVSFGYKKEEAHQQIADTLKMALQTVRNKRRLIMKKLEACRAMGVNK